MNITSDGHPHLGTPLGSSEYLAQYLSEKIQQWSFELKSLSVIATTQSHAAHAAYTHRSAKKWSHLCRIIPFISQRLKVLEDTIKMAFYTQSYWPLTTK